MPVQPPAYRKLVASTRIYFGPGKAEDLDDLAALRGYYQHIYGSLNLEGSASVGQQIQQARRLMDFRAVTEAPSQSGHWQGRPPLRVPDDHR